MDCADCGLEDCGSGPSTSLFRGLGPPRSPLSFADSESARDLHKIHPVGALGTALEAVPWPAQFQ
eukprot:11676840-Alexandrium_andersonii.AAC.1